MPFHPPALSDTLGSLFTEQCRSAPQALAYAFVRDRLDAVESITYAQLQAQVEVLAAEIEQHTRAKDRVLLVYGAGLDVVRAFWACMLTGRIAVPVPAPDAARFKNGAPRLHAIIEDAQARLVLTSADLLGPAKDFLDEQGLHDVVISACDGNAAAVGSAPAAAMVKHAASARATPAPEDVAYLQYTSGSTATPRGVMLSHANVLAQCQAAVHELSLHTADTRLLSWLPHYHDYGLVFGVLWPLFAGKPGYLMSPLTFLRRPLRWLEAIAHFQITHTGAPNFAYAACVKALAQQPDWSARLDTLRSSTCGAEPIQFDTVTAFQDRFAAHGLRPTALSPSYGMAETVLGVTTSSTQAPLHALALDVGPLGRRQARVASSSGPRVRQVVSCGRPGLGMALEIIDPDTKRPLADGDIGEIWVRGSSVGLGYWGQPEATAQTFQARTAIGDGPWLRTGDLGFLRQGELYVTGRLKDLIIVRGRNHAPQDIEWTVQSADPTLRAGYGAAFSIDTDEGEAVVIVQELERRGQDADLAPLVRALRKAVAEEHDLPVHAIAIVRPGSLPRTSSGKIRRQSCKADYLEGNLQVLTLDVAQQVDAAPWAVGDFSARLQALKTPQERAQALEQTLVQGVARFARRAPQDISLEASAIECGLDSLSAFRLLQVLETALGRSLPPALLLGEPTLRGVAQGLAQSLAEPEVTRVPLAPLDAEQRRGLTPLSAAQQRMWFWQELAPGTALYTVPVAVALQGPLDIELLQSCLTALVNRHDILRSRWVSVDGVPHQRVEPEGEFALTMVHLNALGPDAAQRRYDEMAAHEAQHPLDLTREAPVRAQLVQLAPQDHRLLWTLHHSVCDGWSMNVLMDELCRLYEAGCTGQAARLSAVELQYADVAAWEPQWLASGVRERELAYWSRQLAGAPTVLPLPTDHRRPTHQAFRGATHALAFTAGQLAALRALAQSQHCTLFMAVLALWQTLLHRHSGQATVLTGSVVAHRDRREFEQMVGYFANTLALRADFTPGLTTHQLLAQLKATALAAFDHQHLPFEEVVESLHLPRDSSRMPLVQTFVVLQPKAEATRRMGDVTARQMALASPVARFDLSLELQETDDGLAGQLEYDRALFEPASIARLAGHLHQLLDAMCAEPERQVASLPLLTAAERELLVHGWNDTAQALPSHLGVHTLIEQQVQRTPHADAAVFRGQRLDYRSLNERANRLAHHLRRLGVGPDVPVAVCMERSLELVVALLGTLKAGGAFVPLDPALPTARLAHMLNDTAAPVVLTQSALLAHVPPPVGAATRLCLCLDQALPAPQPGDEADPEPVALPEHLAYIIYTSGSTGQPKGVMVPHRALSNHELWLQQLCATAPGDRVLQMTTISFDAAVSDFFMTLMSGATVVLAEPGEHRDTAYLARTLRDERIQIIVLVPALLRLLLAEPALAECHSLRQVMCGGEAMSLELAREFEQRLPQVRLGNFYGPSEATNDSTWCDARGDFGPASSVPIGRPIANAQCHVLDAGLHPVPIGVGGELYIGGAGLARGYLHQPDLTAERFIAHPWLPGERLYRTGDLARYLASGQIEYLGRADTQVKIRGIRIELGEIEAALAALPGVLHVCVLARAPAGGALCADAGASASADKRLVAYVVGPGLTPSSLRQQLAPWLPQALLPSAFVVLPSLPMLTNGKVDRQALPEPDPASARAPEGADASVAPRNPTERAVWQLWQHLLPVATLGVHDNFFELGGHSLLGMQLVSRLRQHFGIDLPLRQLFDAPTVSGLSEWIEAQAGAAPRQTAALADAAPAAAPADAELPLTAAQRGLWFMEKLRGPSAAHHIAHATRLRGRLNLAALQSALEQMSTRHDSLRTSLVERGGVALQRTANHVSWPLQTLTLADAPPALNGPAQGVDAPGHALQRLLSQFAQQPFDLVQPPLARAALIRIGDDEHVFTLVLHHLVSDGWSLDILLNEMASCYEAACAGRPAGLPPLPSSWRNVANAEASRLAGPAAEADLAYWRNRLEHLEPLRLARRTPAPESSRASAQEPALLQTLSLPAALVQAVEALALAHKATVFMVMLAAFNLLLQRRFDRDDIAVGSPVAGRDRADTEPLVALLLNTLVLRTDLSGDPSFAELLQRVRSGTLEDWAHQQLPFDRLVSELAPARHADQHPFFDVMVNAFGPWSGALALPGLQAQALALETVAPRFGMSLYVQSQPGQIGLGLVCRGDRFDANELGVLLDQYRHLLQQVCHAPARPLSDASLLTPTTLALVPDPTVALVAPPFESVVQTFLAVAQRQPTQPALITATHCIDYATLRQRTLALAARLQAAGVQPGDVVALSGPRSLAVVAGMLATQMCGAVFLTLDPALPAVRRRTMLSHAKARWLCLIGRDTAGTAAQELGGPGLTLLDLDPLLESLGAEAGGAEPTLVANAADDAACIFFTSGSTGTPKAVLGRHRGLSQFVAWQRAEFGISPTDRVSQLIGLSFDPLLRDVLLPLTSGAALCVPQDRDLLDPLAWLQAHEVSVVHTTPSVMQSWLQTARAPLALPALRWLFVAGEPLTEGLVRHWREACATEARIVNLYGPTETTLARTFHVLGPQLSPGIQPVGRPLPHSQALVLTPRGQPCGVDEPGEVVLRTPLRSLGYLDNPEENTRRFRVNPWRDDPDDLLYFTGDRGRLRADGRLELQGRLDDQVKIRGVRIEPAEVMAALASHADVRQCTVLPRTDSEDEPLLVAYVTRQPGALATVSALRLHLAALLPEAFVPGAFVFLDSLPLLANGKVDRKALPPPAAALAHHSPSDDRVVMPRSAVERALWDIWRHVLRAEAFGVFESFFELGGHSLLATQVIARLRDVLGVELPLRALFEAPTIATLAAAVELSMQQGEGAATAPPWPALERVRRDGLLPTSYSQRRMWLVQQFNPQTAAYNMPFALRLRGELDRNALLESLQFLVARHEAFRTTLVTVNGEPMQRIWPAQPVPIEYIDLRSLAPAERLPACARALQRRGIVPYDLARGPLHRLSLLQLDDQDHVLFWSMHHTIGDGWSSGILMREVCRVYPALRHGQTPSLPDMAIDFADYAAWQRRALNGPALAGQLAYWKNKLAGLPPLPLPFDHPRRAEHDGRGSRISASFKPKTLAALKALALAHGVTPYMALLAVFQLLLARHCGVTDVAVGTPIANRTHLASEHLVGTLVNTVVMRNDLSGDPSFAELLQRVRETALQAYAHQDLPFEALVEAMELPRSDGAAPLVQVLFNVLNPPQAATQMEGITFEPFDFDPGTSQFDLGLSVDTEMFGEATLSFSREVFEAVTGERLLARYLHLLDQVLADPGRSISSYSLISPAERPLLLQWNDTPVPQQGNALVHFEVEQQAHLTPHAIALRCGDLQISHGALERRAAQLARALRERGVHRGALVGLCVTRGIPMVVAQLAVLKAGAAYVPLDPDYPTERLAFMAQDARLALLVSESGLASRLDWPRAQTLLLDSDAARITSQPDTPLLPNPALDAQPDDPAYVIYTSGSTGRPKGVRVPHRAVVNFLTGMARAPGMDEDDVLVAVTTLSFDIAVLELLLPLCVGARVVLASREQALDGQALHQLLASQGATVMQATPSTWRLLIEAGWQGFPHFKALVGGEALPPDLAQQLLARCGELWNLYGPTETTVWSSAWRVASPERGIRIGRPIANTQIHVLDPRGQPCPIGVAGELFIGGAGVALGYLHQPELTAQRFVADPFSPTPGARLYRTGDRGRWSHEGQLEHLGRLDFQVKVRGHRIELGEIESVLALHVQVAQAVVIVREDRAGDTRLVAYLVLRQAVADWTALREHLRLHLPAYMLPQHLVALPAVPLLPNGKLNRQALPAPAETPRERRGQPDRLTPAEQAVADVWAELLGVTQIDRSDNFFDLGGHSLMAMRAVAGVQERTGIRLELRRLVHESLAQIAATPVTPPAAEGAGPASRPVPLDGPTREARTRSTDFGALDMAPDEPTPRSGLGRLLRGVRDKLGK